MSGTAINPKCSACGQEIDGSHYTWNGHHYHLNHMPKTEPPPVFEVVEIQDDLESPAMWIAFKNREDRERAHKWFVVASQSNSPQGVHQHLTVQRPPGVSSHDLAAS